jgi:sugar/nucleoside kinase (ribokinase family)
VYEIGVIGHVTRDWVRIGGVEREMPGGAGYYFPLTAQILGSKVCLVTKIAEKDKNLLMDLITNKIDVFCRESEETTTFRNVYLADLSSRVQRADPVARPFTLEDVGEISARIFHLGPLTERDIPLDLLEALSERSLISLDVQGFLRRVRGGRIEAGEWEEKEEGLPYVDFLKADRGEAALLSGERRVEKAAIRLSRYGIGEVVITLGKEGSLIYAGGEFYPIPAYPPRTIVDPTGCGDTYMAGYLSKRLQSCPIDEAGKFGAAAASLKLEGFGPFRGSEKEIHRLLASFSGEGNP